MLIFHLIVAVSEGSPQLVGLLLESLGGGLNRLILFEVLGQALSELPVVAELRDSITDAALVAYWQQLLP